MRSGFWAAMLFVCGFFAMVTPAIAHHSLSAEFDTSKEMKVTGVISGVEWTNPHIYIYVDVKEDNGKVDNYAFEGHPPGMARRGGMRKDMFIVGQTVTVTYIPAKDGSKFLGYGKNMKYTDGHEITMWVTDRSND